MLYLATKWQSYWLALHSKRFNLTDPLTKEQVASVPRLKGKNGLFIIVMMLHFWRLEQGAEEVWTMCARDLIRVFELL